MSAYRVSRSGALMRFVMGIALAIGVASCAVSESPVELEESALALAGCEHDTCTEGGPLDPSCGPCEAQVCRNDPFCCDTEWDHLCVSQAELTCGESCP